jgi:preprotein translocase subunit SecD
MSDAHENVFYFKNQDIKTLLSLSSVTLDSLKNAIKTEKIPLDSVSTFRANLGEVTLGNQSGTAFALINTLDQSNITAQKELEVRMLFIHKDPLRFQPAIGKNEEILDEKHLINTIPSLDPTTGSSVVNLIFDTEGQKMFGDITERNAGGIIAIFLGNQLLTAPTVSGRIDGNAIITSGGETDSKKWAAELSKSVNE